MKEKMELQTQKKRFFTAMEYKGGMMMANQKENNDQVDYDQGTKSKNFKFVSKLQSLGRVSQWRLLENQIKDVRLVDID